MSWVKLDPQCELRVNDSPELTFMRNECHGYDNQESYRGCFDFYGSLSGWVDDSAIQIASVSGCINPLLDRFATADDADASSSSEYFEDAILPFFDDRENGGGVNEFFEVAVDGEGTGGVIYIERITIHPQIAHSTLAMSALFSVTDFIYDLQPPMPIVAILGRHREESRKGEVIDRYFSRWFEKTQSGTAYMVADDAMNHGLPLSGIENIQLMTVERAERKRKDIEWISRTI